MGRGGKQWRREMHYATVNVCVRVMVQPYLSVCVLCDEILFSRWLLLGLARKVECAYFVVTFYFPQLPRACVDARKVVSVFPFFFARKKI